MEQKARSAEVPTFAQELLPDLVWLDLAGFNAFLVGNPEKNKHWTLVDAGPEHSAKFIFTCAEERFGKGSKPQAILLTHAHLEQVGAVAKLCKDYWDVPVYVHPQELPFITGKNSDLGLHALPLPSDGRCPGLPEWRWLHTPGHSPGHVAYLRQSDGLLLFGDAAWLSKDLTFPEVNWDEAQHSLHILRDLYPELAIASHGKPLAGAEFTQKLDLLVTNFPILAKLGSDRLLQSND